tara:strand:+ start:24541 stop:26712 length:2172 start_codon:yes stop_codon:yes gene_type:complete
MFSDTERGILVRLSEFGESLEDSWDVPRAISLPGLANSLGLVRSSLHKPLTRLETEGLIFIRIAHVIGGGSRKRKVVHITSEGRKKVSMFENIIPIKSGKSFGQIPDLSRLFGRDTDKDNLTELINEGNSIFLSGLPGIGKTSLARNLVPNFLDLGWTVRWATCYSNTDISNIAFQWTDNKSLRNINALSSYCDKNKNLLIIDEIQEIHSRHIESVAALINLLKNGKCVILVIVRSPNPFHDIDGFSEYRLQGLDEIDGKNLLPDEIDRETASEVVKALGGHPLALHLWNPESDLPAEVEAVQEFVKSNVISKLSDDAVSTLDELSLSPIPLEENQINVRNGIMELDNSAILRWFGNKSEPHHLIRNVRRSFWSQKQKQEMHQNAVKHWTELKGENARWIETYHRVNSNNFESLSLIKSISSISKENSAAAALLIEDAIRIKDDDNLRIKAVDIAFERAELEVVENHLRNIHDSPQKKLRMARLFRSKGDIKSAIEFEESCLKLLLPREQIRLKISTLVRKFDDRLPRKINKHLAKDILLEINNLDLKDISDNDRSTAELALNLLKHSIALEIKDMTLASQSRTELENLLSDNEQYLLMLDLRARLAISNTPELSNLVLDSTRNFIENCSDQFKKISMIHHALDFTKPDFPDWLIESHEKLFEYPLREDAGAYRRLSAQCWYWRGVIDPTHRLSYWQEAIHRFRAAECNEAANELLEELTKSI